MNRSQQIEIGEFQGRLAGGHGSTHRRLRNEFDAGLCEHRLQDFGGIVPGGGLGSDVRGSSVVKVGGSAVVRGGIDQDHESGARVHGRNRAFQDRGRGVDHEHVRALPPVADVLPCEVFTATR